MATLVAATLFNAYVRHYTRRADASRARQVTARPETRNAAKAIKTDADLKTKTEK
jgi:hypothetical protein